MVIKSGTAAFPAIRSHMGDWVYYVTTMKFNDIKSRVFRTDQIHQNEQLRDWIQRKLTPRSNVIANYLINQKQRFFNAIILGIYGGKPEWFPIEIGESPTLGKPQLALWAKESIGLLQLSGKEKIFAIDGQHRVEAIRTATGKEPSLGEEEQSAIFVAHATDKSGKERTRRLFSTLNRYAKPVSKGEIVALDEDDSFAITARRLAEEYEPLTGRHVYYGQRTQLPPTEKSAVTSILSLYEITMILSLPTGATKKEQEQFTRLRKPEDELNVIYKSQIAFWDSLQANILPIKKAMKTPPSEQVAGKFRTTEGGHIMFRPIAQKAFASATRALIDKRFTVANAVARLSKLPMNLEAPQWSGIFWDPITRSRRSRQARNLTLAAMGS